MPNAPVAPLPPPFAGPILPAPALVDVARDAVFLDIDGTLLEFAHGPDAVRVPSGLPARLQGLHRRLGGALAVVSGRALASIDRLLAPARLPAAGLHGLERRDAGGGLHIHPVDDAALGAIIAMLERDFASIPGIHLEAKGMAVAIHFRGAPDRADEIAARLGRLGPALGPAFEIQPGAMVFEIKPRGADKGTAIAAFLAEPPFAGRRPVFLGDDLTDEHGFEAVNRRDGLSVIVGTRVPTCAGARLSGVEAVHDWLADLGLADPAAEADARP
jgi:trehalose 6-phosphate phosphatase